MLTHHAQPRSCMSTRSCSRGRVPQPHCRHRRLRATFVHHGLIARLTRDGSATLYTLDSAAVDPPSSPGPDRALWFTRPTTTGRPDHQRRRADFTLPTSIVGPRYHTRARRGFVVRTERTPTVSHASPRMGRSLNSLYQHAEGFPHSSHQVRTEPSTSPSTKPKPSVE